MTDAQAEALWHELEALKYSRRFGFKPSVNIEIFYLMSILRNLIKQLDRAPTFNYVKVHQDNLLPSSCVWEKMSVVVDARAKVAL